jgi:hypothetical protein
VRIPRPQPDTVARFDAAPAAWIERSVAFVAELSPSLLAPKRAPRG